jgi:hypothetical protein
MIENCYVKTTVNSCTNFHKINFIKICTANFQSRVSRKADDAAAAPVAAEKEPQTSGRSSRLGRSARRPRIRPCRSSRSKATNLKICLTPNGTVDRSATNFVRKIFEGKNFVMPKAVFRYLPGFTGIFFRTIFVRKNYVISNFLGMLCMLLQNFYRSAISRNFRGTRKFIPDVTA